ncbi:MAG: VWA domain-containing protein [Eubacterium sp.]
MVEDLKSNPSDRLIICFCVDNSLSMLGDKMNRVNEQIRKFINNSKEDIYASSAIDMSIISFDRDIKFESVKKINFKPLEASGTTPLAAEVRQALSAIDDRLEQYDDMGISHYKPWLIIMSDGRPTDDISAVAREVCSRIRNRELKVQCLNLDKKDDGRSLKAFTPEGTVQPITDLTEIDDFFSMLSRSAAGLSRESTDNEEGFL